MTVEGHPANSVTARVTRRINAPPERVFAVWLDPQRTGMWHFATPTGTIVRVAIDPRVGGRYRFTNRRAGDDVEHTGECLDLDRPRRLVLTLSVPAYSQEVDRIVVAIIPVGSGCELTLSPERALLHDQEAERRVTVGWTTVLHGLAETIGEPAGVAGAQSAFPHA